MDPNLPALAGIRWDDQKANRILITITMVVILLFNLPTTYGTLKHFLPYRAPSRIPYEELTALDFLRQQSSGTVLIPPFNPRRAEKADVPRALDAYVSTAYVSALSEHPVYLEDEINLEILGVDWRPRREKVDWFFATIDESAAQQFLETENITYIYFYADQKPFLALEPLGMKKIFDNGLVYIYSRI